MIKKDGKDIVFVFVQFALFGAYLLPIPLDLWENSLVVNFIGMVMAVLGGGILFAAMIQLNTNLSPFPSPKTDGKLVQTGLYKHVRHPIYTGIFLLFLGFGLFSANGYKILVSFVILLLFYIKSRYEEQKLMEKFEDYTSYKGRTGRFFPLF